MGGEGERLGRKTILVVEVLLSSSSHRPRFILTGWGVGGRKKASEEGGRGRCGDEGGGGQGFWSAEEIRGLIIRHAAPRRKTRLSKVSADD